MQSREFYPDKPILSWRIFDKVEVSKEKKQKIFYNSKKKLTQMELKRLEPIIRALREKWVDILNREFFQVVKKRHFTVAGGNHTFFFILPDTLKHFQAKYPHLSVRLALFEPHMTSDLTSVDAPEVIFSGLYRDADTGKVLEAVKLNGYDQANGFCNETVHFGASKDAVAKYGSKRKTLMEHHLIYGRAYKTDDRTGKAISYPYAVVPEGRKNEQMRAIIDQAFLTHILMKKMAGIFILFKTMTRDDELCKLHETPISVIDRYFLYKQNVSGSVRKQCAFVKKSSFALLKNRKKT